MTNGEVFSAFIDALSSCMDRPMLMMIAGPNGAGKTTLWNRTLSRVVHPEINYINADEIEREINWLGDGAPQTDETAYAAQIEATRLREMCIRNGDNLVFETVFSDEAGHKLKELKQAKDAGYFVVMVFVGVSDLVVSKQRVAKRVVAGGHNVDEARQEARFPRVYANGQRALEIVDVALFMDNSKERECLNESTAPVHRAVAICMQGQVPLMSSDLPLWVNRILA